MKFRNSLLLTVAILIGASLHNLCAQTTQFLWAKPVASTVNLDGELAIGMAMDNATNLYVTGWFDGTNDFGGTSLTNKSGGGQDIFVGKYNSNGVLQWARRAGGSSASRDAGRGVGVDTNGNVYATGGFYSTADFGSINVTSASAQSFFLTKYNSNGVAQWVRQSINGGSVGTGSYGMALAVDASGNSYAAGCFSGVTTITLGTTTLTNAGSYNIFLVKYDNIGGFQWAKSFNSPGWSYANAVTLDSNSNVYVTGTFNPSVGIGATNFTSAGGKDGFVAKFNSAGALQWARQMAGNSDDTAQAASVDVAGNVYVCGGFGNAAGDTVSFGSGITLTNIGGGRPGAGIGDAFIAKYNSAGAPQWARRAGGTQMDVYSGVSADAYGNIYVTGGAGSALIPGAFNVVIARYDSNGVVQWPPDATSTLALPWAGPMVDAGGNCYLAGWFQTNAVFGTNTITGPGYFDYFLAKLAPGALVASNAPAVTTGTATVLDSTLVTLNGTVNPNGLATTAQFEYGLTTAYGNTTNVALSPNNGSTPQAVSASLCGLQPGMTYHFRLTVINSGGSGNGDDATFTLPPLPYTYTTNNGTITITGYTGSGGAEAIPNTINCLPVTRIGDWAFSGSSVVSITIAPSVTSIGNFAFNNCSLANVTIPGSVTNIGDLAFAICRNLTSVTIPASVTRIGYAAFIFCTSLSAFTVEPGNAVYSSVDGIVLDKNQTTLIQFPGGRVGSYAIPAGIINIGDAAFQGCEGLTNISIPASVSSIGDQAFSGCSGLNAITVDAGNASYSSVAGVLFDKSQTTLIQCPGTKAGTYAIPAGVTRIAGGAFEGCSSLTSVTIPASVTSIGYAAFQTGDLMTAITVDSGNAVFSSLDGVLFDKSQTTLIHCPGGRIGAYSIPDSVISIGDQAFASCSSLTGVTIPGSVTSIGDGAFSWCHSLTRITIPASVTSIGDSAFIGCGNLIMVTIGGGVTNIGDGAFVDCASLTKVILKGNAPTIGLSIFGGDNNATVYYMSGTTGWGPTFGGRPTALWSLVAVTMNYTTNNGTITITGYSGSGGTVAIPETINGLPVVNIGDNAFDGCTDLTNVSIPNSVTNIGNWAFADCENLISVSIGNSVVSVGLGAFARCAKLLAITVDALNPVYSSVDGVLFNRNQTLLLECPGGKIGYYSIPSYVTNVALGAFAFCYGLTEITIPVSVGGIGDYAFYLCSNLTSVTIPKSVSSIGDGAFYGCTSLTGVYFNGNAPSLGIGTFESFSNLTVYYPD